MASYFVGDRCAGGDHQVHDRSRCPPACFAPETHLQYLGDFLDAAQAICVARVRYPQVQGCPCCGAAETCGDRPPLAGTGRPLSSGA